MTRNKPGMFLGDRRDQIVHVDVRQRKPETHFCQLPVDVAQDDVVNRR